MKSTTCSTPPSSSNRASLAAHRSSPHDTAPRYSARTVPFVVAATRSASPKVTRPISPRTAPMPKLPASRVETSDPAVENVRYNLDAGSHMVIWPASPRSSKARADRSSFGPSPSRPNVTTSAPRWNPCTKGSTGVRTQMIPSFSITSTISQRSASADSQVISSESMLIDPGPVLRSSPQEPTRNGRTTPRNRLEIPETATVAITNLRSCWVYVTLPKRMGKVRTRSGLA